MELRFSVTDSIDQHLLLAVMLSTSGEMEETGSSLVHRNSG